MSHTYEYARAWHSADSHYDIGYDDPEESRNEPSLVEEIYSAISERPAMRCITAQCFLTFAAELSGPDKTTLDSTVASHKAAAP